MSALAAQRDDGPLVAALARRVPRRGRAAALAWFTVPLVRGCEYAILVALTALTAPFALPACFALLVVLAFHHYDTAYRIRVHGTPPPVWLRFAGLCWDGRSVAAAILASVGALEGGLVIGAAALGVLYVAEAIVAWVGVVRREPRAPVEVDDGELLA